MQTLSFEALDLIEPIQRALEAQNYTVPTPVQQQAIPLLLAGNDLLGSAQTGSGKTAAFALPILQHLAIHRRPPQRTATRTLILAPTRELVAQIADSFATYGRHLGLRQATVYGGVGKHGQIKALQRGVDILTATPRRLLDLLGDGVLRLDRVEIFVLDEADRMLDMGFIPAIDIAARGIDVEDISHVINFELPNEPESYVHRIGRTARAGKTGTALSFCDPSENEYLRRIERQLKRKMPGQGTPLRRAFCASVRVQAPSGANGPKPHRRRRRRPAG